MGSINQTVTVDATVVEVRAPELLSLLVEGPGFRVRHTYEVGSSGDGASLGLTGDYRGLAGRLVFWFMRRSVVRDLSEELAAIKAAAEAAAKG